MYRQSFLTGLIFVMMWSGWGLSQVHAGGGARELSSAGILGGVITCGATLSDQLSTGDPTYVGPDLITHHYDEFSFTPATSGYVLFTVIATGGQFTPYIFEPSASSSCQTWGYRAQYGRSFQSGVTYTIRVSDYCYNGEPADWPYTIEATCFTPDGVLACETPFPGMLTLGDDSYVDGSDTIYYDDFMFMPYGSSIVQVVGVSTGALFTPRIRLAKYNGATWDLLDISAEISGDTATVAASVTGGELYNVILEHLPPGIPAPTGWQYSLVITCGTTFYPGAIETFSTDVTNPTPGGTTGWTPVSAYQTGQVTDYDSANQALRVTVSTGTGQPRVNGWVSANSEWLSVTPLGGWSHWVVRGKFYIFSKGQADPENLNQIPNMRMRLASRFAITSMLEVFNHLGTDPVGTLAGQDLRPSSDPNAPSLYRVDLVPVAVPAMFQAGEGILRGYEAYSLEDQENGAVDLAESVVGYYPRARLSDDGPEVDALRVFQPTSSDAGDLRVFNSTADGPFIRKFTYLAPGVLGSEVPLDGSTDPLYWESDKGLYFDTQSVDKTRFGIISREFTEMGANSSRFRVTNSSLHKIRFHVLGTTNANTNPQVRFRARSLKFMWSQKFEIGGAFAAGSLNNTLAQQALPGSGSMNPDQLTPGESGGWYTLILNTPISTDIRASQPYIAAQPGPGSAANSMRDIKLGMDLIDTLSGSASSGKESGQILLDQIEIRQYGLVAD